MTETIQLFRGLVITDILFLLLAIFGIVAVASLARRIKRLELIAELDK